MQIAEKLQESGLMFQVVSRPICLTGNSRIEDIPVCGPGIESHVANVRQDTGDILGVVGTTYKVIQNAEALGIADFLDGDIKNVRQIDGGRIVVAELNIGRFKIADDDCEKRIFLRTSHDGSCSLEARMQVLRLVCSNGLVAWRDKSSVKIRHTISANDKIREARRVLGVADEYYKRLDVMFNKLIETPLSYAAKNDFLDKLIGKPDNAKKRDCITPVRERIMAALHTSRDLRQYEDTGWGMYNAVAEYVDHNRGNNIQDDKAFAMRNWGSGFDLKTRAFDLLTI